MEERIAVSLAQRKTDQATLVRKLSTYKSNHPLLETFTEYNRLVKAQYLLSYVDDAELRNHVQKALNRGEAYHQLRRAISQVNGDRFRGNSDEEIELWNECARLVANAIINFNSKILSNLLQSFEHQGKAKLVDVIKRASPVAWQSINLKGEYLFADAGETPDIEYLMATIEEQEPLPVTVYGRLQRVCLFWRENPRNPNTDGGGKYETYPRFPPKVFAKTH